MNALAGKALSPLKTLAAIIVFSLVALNCGEAEEEQMTPSPAPPTPVVSPAITPVASPTGAQGEQPGDVGFREFAAKLDEALKQDPVAFLQERMKTTHVVCGPEDVPPGLGGPACESVGQEFEGFDVSAWRSEGATVPAETAVTGLERFFEGALAPESDEFGDGAPQVYALNVGGRLVTPLGAGPYDAIVTAIIERPEDFAGEGPLRVALNTAWTFEDGRWLLTGVMYAYVLGDELLRPAEEARQLFPNWERFEGG
jgi:hypothetical protein